MKVAVEGGGGLLRSQVPSSSISLPDPLKSIFFNGRVLSNGSPNGSFGLVMIRMPAIVGLASPANKKNSALNWRRRTGNSAGFAEFSSIELGKPVADFI